MFRASTSLNTPDWNHWVIWLVYAETKRALCEFRNQLADIKKSLKDE